MAAILKSAQKGGGGPTYKAIIDQWGALNKMIPLMEDPGGGCTVTPLGPWTILDIAKMAARGSFVLAPSKIE